MGIEMFVIHQQQVTALQATRACLWTIDPSPVLVIALSSQAVVSHQETTAGGRSCSAGGTIGAFVQTGRYCVWWSMALYC